MTKSNSRRLIKNCDLYVSEAFYATTAAAETQKLTPHLMRCGALKPVDYWSSLRLRGWHQTHLQVSKDLKDAGIRNWTLAFLRELNGGVDEDVGKPVALVQHIVGWTCR
jgi:hypothetical protein